MTGLNGSIIDDMAFRAEMSSLAEQVKACLAEDLRQHGAVLPPHLRQVSESYLTNTGKCLRPALLLLCCGAAGGSLKGALPAAAAVEMFHNWTLLHDDVIDHDSFRRGRPTGHVLGASLGQQDLQLPAAAAAEYGQSLAILAGDLLQARAFNLLLSVSGQKDKVVIGLARRMAVKLTSELLAGEQLDVQLSQTPFAQVKEADVMDVMRLKTGALLSFCAETGVALAERRLPEDSTAAQGMAKFAELCGIAFQIQDDILGLSGDEETLGKPIGSDIREGKRTLLALRALQSCSEQDRKTLLGILGNAQADAADIEKARAILLRSRSLDGVREYSEDCVKQAMTLLEKHLPENRWRNLLAAWAKSMTHRSM
ncbi:MAG: polyprenyl synthetase family protein [Lentisphaerae bacterium]|jgi:geranylgeranyl diphosphate synthase type I|nr:polyprenyl synthetase family protein [Lentisphaerota bacterium]